VNRLVPRALEAICLKAMALKPSDRYQSPRALVDDVEHWLADEAVAALPETISQSVARWARKHRQWTLAGAACLSVVSIVGVVSAF
jgi:eukaryotic-like serine/threonine-protein kinase